MKFSSLKKDELQNLVNESNSIADVLNKLGYSKCKSAYDTFYRYAKKHNIRYSHFKLGLNNRKGKISRFLTKEQFLKNINEKQCIDKNLLIRFNLLENKCYANECNIKNIWLNKPLVLHLDHIDGNNKNNNIDNLRFLCPNCHSQTDTYSGKNKTKVNHNCVDCDAKITSRSIRCKSCSSKMVNSKRKKFIITKEKLTELLKNHSYREIAKMYNVSDTTVRKRYRIDNI